MGSHSVVTCKEFEISKVTFGEVKKLGNNGKYVPIYYNRGPFLIQTPECYSPFGMNVYEDKDTTDSKSTYSIELSFKDKETRPSLETYFEILEQIDKRVVEETLKNSQRWISKPLGTDVVIIEALFTKTVRFPKDKDTGLIITKYPPTFRLKLAKNPSTSAFNCSTYDALTNDAVELETMIPKMKGSKIKAIANCSGVWLAGGKFGVSWKAQQMMISVNSGLRENAFMNIPDENITNADKEQEESDNPDENDEEIVAKVTDAQISESDNDSDSVEIQEPVRKMKKKVSTK
jgi:hypothetical protein